MPLPKAQPTDLPATFAEVQRLLAQTDDVLVRSTARLRQADTASRQASRDNAHLRGQLDAFRRALAIPRSSGGRSFL